MPTDRRRDAATALTGAGLLGAGGSLRHAGVTGALRGKLGKEPGTKDYPRVHLSALRGAGRGPKGLYLAGTVLGTVGAAGLSAGTVNLFRRHVDKRDKNPLWREGLAGTGDALRGRADSIKTPTPPKVRASQWVVAGAAGAGGSALARLALRHSPGRTKALLGPVAGGLAATASIPVSNRVVRRQSKGEYVVTPTGVRRAKDVIKKPSTKAHMVSGRHGSLRQQVVPGDDRFGKSTSYRQQRAAITAAGATPVIGPYAQAHLAGSYAPQGQRAKNAARQFAMGPVAGNAAGVGGAYGAAALAHRVTSVGDKAEGAMAWRSRQVNRLRGKIGLGEAKPAAEGTLRHAARAAAEAHPLAKPLLHSRGTMAAAGLGFLATRALVGTAGAQTAISLNQRDQSRARIGKLDSAPGQTKREKHRLASSKRTNAALATVSGTAGLTALGLLATRHKGKAIPVSIFGSGVGGANALLGAHVQRREAHVIDPVKKAANTYVIAGPTKHRLIAHKTPLRRMRANGKDGERYPAPEELYGESHLKGFGDPLHKAYLPELPMGNIPRQAIHKMHGKVRVLAYHGENRFTVLAKGDRKVLAHREHLTFLPEHKGGGAVTKSFVNGGVKRAINLSTAERAAVRARSGTGPRGPLLSRGTSPKDNPFNDTYSALHGVKTEEGTKRNLRFAQGEFGDEAKNAIAGSLPKRLKRPITFHAFGGPEHKGLAFPSAGTQRSSHVLIHGNEAMATHEAAHAIPRRNALRIAGMNGLQRAREEGRADAVAMQHHGLSDVMGGDYDTVARVRRQADAGDARSKQKLNQIHTTLAADPSFGKPVAGAATTYQTRAQSRAYLDVRRRMGKPLGPTPVQFNKDLGADHRDLIRRYGDRGPLPKGLARDEKIRAYEARYAAHGGPKGEKWQRRANAAETVRNVALGAGTTALAGLAHLKTKRGARLATKHPGLHNRLDHMALSAGAVGGGAELFGELARDRRASYSNSPGGVAASALTRLRANTPKEQR